MASLLDPNNEVETTEGEELGSIDDIQAEANAAPEEPTTAAADTDDLPEKYRGKSAADIAKMHVELEKRLGQQSQEVGELRQAFDKMVQDSVNARAQEPQVPEVEEADFFADPKEAVRRAIESHPTMQQAREVAAEMAKNASLARLQQAHPDMNDVLRDPAFNEWVSASPVRRELFARADEKYDADAADELLSTFKERRSVVQQTAAVEETARKTEVRNASTGTARANPEAAKVRKVYRRRDIIDLMKRDPKRYQALLPEIKQAYAEGRVK